MFQMTIEIYTMGSNCNLQTFVPLESDFLVVIYFQLMIMVVIFCLSEFILVIFIMIF